VFTDKVHIMCNPGEMRSGRDGDTNMGNTTALRWSGTRTSLE
jgi:hypothetical protein